MDRVVVKREEEVKAAYDPWVMDVSKVSGCVSEAGGMKGEG